MSRSWHPSPAIRLSFALHGGAAAAVLAAPQCWPWALGAVGANHLLLTAAGLAPRCRLLGTNLNRLPARARQRREIALTIDDGPDPEVTPRILDLLDGAGARATFFCIGRRARQAPAVCRQIVARGHTVENHGDAHSSFFSTYGVRRMYADVAAAQATLADITGVAPRFFRPTAGLRNPLLDPVLARLDLRLASWTRRSFDTRDGNPERVHRRLTQNLSAGDILLLHDGHAARTTCGEAVSVAVLPRLLRTVTERQLLPVPLTVVLDEFPDPAHSGS